MIKSPLTSPLRPALTSPYELITRSVFELNGTQWGELSEPVVLDGDFEIEVVSLGKKDEWAAFVAGDDFSFRKNNLNDVEIRTVRDDGSATVRAAQLTPELVTVSSLKALDGYLTIKTDIESTVSVDDLKRPINITRIGKAPTNNNTIPIGADPFSGLIFRVRIWTNGDLILDVPFDESGSDYQRDVSQPVGAELSDIYEGLSVSSLGAYQTPYINTSLDTSKYYIAEMRIDEVISGSIKINTDSNDSAFLTSSGVYRVGFTGSSYGSIQTGVDGFIGSVSLSIREWSGVILQNALPEDWMQIEKKRYWDYWREVGNESNILEIAS